ncbi:hypothetical protein OE88DRAFT_1644917 [Heliocybe sulcata]|uniref:Uncharacterized protein n=1 Tax=Heliocybe sulcata TaxID=5364 RepID=A0A5C3N389_9AGAM|nr:hypothetical protein OE88DRAFT_1644917 [Heliocybe sulcata]
MAGIAENTPKLQDLLPSMPTTARTLRCYPPNERDDSRQSALLCPKVIDVNGNYPNTKHPRFPLSWLYEGSREWHHQGYADPSALAQEQPDLNQDVVDVPILQDSSIQPAHALLGTPKKAIRLTKALSYGADDVGYYPLGGKCITAGDSYSMCSYLPSRNVIGDLGYNLISSYISQHRLRPGLSRYTKLPSLFAKASLPMPSPLMSSLKPPFPQQDASQQVPNVMAETSEAFSYSINANSVHFPGDPAMSAEELQMRWELGPLAAGLDLGYLTIAMTHLRTILTDIREWWPLEKSPACFVPATKHSMIPETPLVPEMPKLEGIFSPIPPTWEPGQMAEDYYVECLKRYLISVVARSGLPGTVLDLVLCYLRELQPFVQKAREEALQTPPVLLAKPWSPLMLFPSFMLCPYRALVACVMYSVKLYSHYNFGIHELSCAMWASISGLSLDELNVAYALGADLEIAWMGSF